MANRRRVESLSQEYQRLGYDRPGLASIHAIYTALGYTDNPAPRRSAEEEGQEEALGRVKSIKASPLRPKRIQPPRTSPAYRSPEEGAPEVGPQRLFRQSPPHSGGPDVWTNNKSNMAICRKEVVEYLLHRMPRQRLQQIMVGEFQKADGGKGYLTHQELVRCLKNWSGFGVQLSKAEIMALLADADVDHNGRIYYNEFVPFCFSMLVDLVAQKQTGRSPNQPEDNFNLAASVRSNVSILVNQKVVSPTSAVRARQQQQRKRQQLLVQQLQNPGPLLQQSLLLPAHSRADVLAHSHHIYAVDAGNSMNMSTSSGRFVPASPAAVGFTPAASVRSLRSNGSANISQNGSLGGSLGGFRNVDTGEGANLYVDTTATGRRSPKSPAHANSAIKLHKLSGSASLRRSASASGRSLGTSAGSSRGSTGTPRSSTRRSPRTKPQRPFY